jgi:hypothetical protein
MRDSSKQREMPGASETETSPLFEIALVLVRFDHVAAA